jgi:hypothetical protein
VYTFQVDKEVSTQIDYYNDHLKLSNRGISTPRLYQDIILSNKSKGDPRVEYSIKYTDAEAFIRLILGDGVVWTFDKVY